MRGILDCIKQILYADRTVSELRRQQEWSNQEGIVLIASLSFLVMSLLNVAERSYEMLVTTAVSSLLLAGWQIGRKKKNIALLQNAFLLAFLVVFSVYTVIGGNRGFAALWLILVPYVAMAVNLRKGFCISLYYQLMLVLLFWGPLKPLLRYDYGGTFLLRFPFLYLIDFCLATFLSVRIRLCQFELLKNEEELRRLGTIDLTTGLLNRNSFNSFRIPSAAGLQSVSAIYLDVNGLHEINNRGGHRAGDEMLCAVAALCTKHFPSSLIYRVGGDEFLILTENQEEQALSEAGQRLGNAVAEAGYSVAYGIETQTGPFDLDRLVGNADMKMLRNKEAYYQRQKLRERWTDPEAAGKAINK